MKIGELSKWSIQPAGEAVVANVGDRPLHLGVHSSQFFAELIDGCLLLGDSALSFPLRLLSLAEHSVEVELEPCHDIKPQKDPDDR